MRPQDPSVQASPWPAAGGCRARGARAARGGRAGWWLLCAAGLLALGILPARAVAQATPSLGDDALGSNDITPGSVAAVARALAWLAKEQDPATGSWKADIGYKLNQDYEISTRHEPHVGVTALAALAFLSAGHLPGRGEYGDVIGRATDFLLGCQDESGYITANGSRMYSHAFATLYLAEVFGMTERTDLMQRLQLAVDYIVDAQNEFGSWRYVAHAAESDMSITVCQLNALRAARNVGIRVPRSTIDRAVDYVIDSYVNHNGDRWSHGDYYRIGRGSFRYQAQDNTRSSFALTAAGLAALHNAGVDGLSLEARDGKPIDLRYSIEFLRDCYDLIGPDSRYYTHYFYWYGHYYATQALYVIGGDAWAWYYPRIRSEILDSQEPDGSLPCRIGPGKTYSTAVAAVILALPYGYLPIFQR